jgi:hypothetical protein
MIWGQLILMTSDIDDEIWSRRSLGSESVDGLESSP